LVLARRCRYDVPILAHRLFADDQQKTNTQGSINTDTCDAHPPPLLPAGDGCGYAYSRIAPTTDA